MHLKRNKAPKNWPIKRKGTKYIVKPKFSIKEGIPLLIILRDILRVAQTRKEVKRAIHLNHILVNRRPARDEQNSLLLFDTLSIIPMKKHYRTEISEKGKISLKEITEEESKYKVSKIYDKKTLKNKKTQINLKDGRNFLSEIKCNVNDSVRINLEEKKIEECIPLEENQNVFVFAGKHAGKNGVISKVNKKEKTLEIKIKDNKINVLFEQIIVAK